MPCRSGCCSPPPKPNVPPLPVVLDKLEVPDGGNAKYGGNNETTESASAADFAVPASLPPLSMGEDQAAPTPGCSRTCCSGRQTESCTNMESRLNNDHTGASGENPSESSRSDDRKQLMEQLDRAVANGDAGKVEAYSCATSCCSKPKTRSSNKEETESTADTKRMDAKNCIKSCCSTKFSKDALVAPAITGGRCAKGCCAGEATAEEIFSQENVKRPSEGFLKDVRTDCSRTQPSAGLTTSPQPLQCAKGCCSRNDISGPPSPKIPIRLEEKPSPCSNTNPAPSVRSCMDSCCEAIASRDAIETMSLRAKHDLSGNIEKALSGTEHVIISISGMTCTGCETKLKRTLGTLSSVKNLKTSLILARAEFDIDLALNSPDDVVKHLERTTEFKCQQVRQQGSSLDLICSFDSISVVKGSWPEGVTDIEAIDKTTVKVTYDARVCGARDLVERGWETPMQLAPLQSDPTLDAGNRHIRHMGFMTILSVVLTIPVLVMAWAPLPEREIAFGCASLVLATIVQVAVAGPFYPKALKDLIFSRTIEMDLLIVLSTSAAYVFSVVSFGYMAAGKPLATGDFFETATLLVTIIMIGRYISAMARQKAAESISIRSLQTPTAVLVDKEGHERKIDARLLQFGDTFKVSPESRIPTDGTVITGSSEVDESMMTGESIPVAKHPRSTVVAGSINGPGTLTVRLTRLPGDNTISTIASMVDEAKLSKPKIQDMADRVASYFVPVVVALTIVTFVIWVAAGKAVRKQSGSEATVQALTYAITVLIVSCPCAIGLAVPMVVVIASGVAAQRGVIFKSVNSIEVAYKATDVVFDKTGTLTQGELTVKREVCLAKDTERTKSLLLGLVDDVKHPVSLAITKHLKNLHASISVASQAKSLPGKGVEGVSSGHKLRAGNSAWLKCDSHPHVQSILADNLTAFCFSIDGVLAAVYGLQDTLRKDAVSAVSSLQASGVAVHILSGDDDNPVRWVASQLNVAGSNVRSRCSPADKQSYIRELQNPAQLQDGKGSKMPTVIFIGDGTNDAPSLAQATIGVHIATGTDTAQAAADVVLMRPTLSGIITMIAISRKAIHRIAFNFGWSFVYNLFAVSLGAGAFVAAGKNVRIPPEFAGLGELVSVLPVIAAAIALRWSEV